MKPNPSKEAMLAEIMRSRMAIRRDTVAVREEFDVRKKVAAVVRKSPFAWVGGAATLGFLFSQFRKPAGKKSSSRKEKLSSPAVGAARPIGFLAFVLGVLKLLVPAFRPALSAYAAKRLADLAGNLVSSGK